MKITEKTREAAMAEFIKADDQLYTIYEQTTQQAWDNYQRAKALAWKRFMDVPDAIEQGRTEIDTSDVFDDFECPACHESHESCRCES